MIKIFLTSLFGTLIITRIITHLFHDKKNYRTKREKSKTISGWLRKRTNYDWHHIHFGILLLIFILINTFVFGLTTNQIIFYGIALSLIVDQIIPFLFKKRCYFSKLGILSTILLHLIVGLSSLLIL